MVIESSVLCVHAHPDDEALFTGGLLARCHDQGVRAGVVTCTYQEGHRRVGELRRSLEILGAGPPRLLGYRDSRPAAEGAFCTAPFDEAVGRLVGHLREFRPDNVVTYDGFGTYGHIDHIRAHRVTLAAVEAAGYPQLYPEAGPVWRPKVLYQVTFPRSTVEQTWRELFGAEVPPEGPGVAGVPDDWVDARLDVRPWLDRKWEAFRQHESETERGAGPARFLALPEETRTRLLGTEWFLRRDLTGQASKTVAIGSSS
ncbi:PIG-L family deacetylase [Amycolatopsis anabasis]|uniref:PIG-L family deacetylase n=1 Tax=Amycolatopsis anabasis TaxID=1840409 RepID=UPI00131BF1E9|nr:PIG-L family deacetylase [Amycolatopsis anabasis]